MFSLDGSDVGSTVVDHPEKLELSKNNSEVKK